jgi:coatomer protein complex subunit gamma
VEIVNFFGNVGTVCKNRSELVRALSNRLSLENSEVRAATVDALFSFVKDPDFGRACTTVIRRLLLDTDDEVRDRAVFYVQIIDKGYAELLDIEKPTILNTPVIAEPVRAAPKAESYLDRYGECVLESVAVKATDDEADLVVSYVTRLFADVIVLDFTVKNTLSEAILNVIADLKNPDMPPFEAVPAPRIDPDASEHVYCVIKRPSDDELLFGRYECIISLCRESDPETEDTFELDNGAEIKIAAYMKPISVGNFNATNAELASERTENVRLSRTKSIGDAIAFFESSTGLSIASREEVTDAKKRKLTVVKMAGSILGRELVLVSCELAPAVRGGGFPARITVKADKEDTCESVMNSLIE